MNHTLIQNQTVCYGGQYVAFKEFEDHVVIASGPTPQEVYDEAVAKGYKDPVVAFVPPRGIVQIY